MYLRDCCALQCQASKVVRVCYADLDCVQGRNRPGAQWV